MTELDESETGSDQNQKQIYCQEGFYTNKELVLLEKLNTFKTINKQLTNTTRQNNALQHTMAAVRGTILKPAVLVITCFNWQLNPVCCLKPLSHMHCNVGFTQRSWMCEHKCLYTLPCQLPSPKSGGATRGNRADNCPERIHSQWVSVIRMCNLPC